VNLSEVPLSEVAGAVVSALIGSAVAAAEAAMAALPPGRLAGLVDETPPAYRPALARFAEAPDRVVGRWQAARILTTATTAELVTQFPGVKHPLVVVAATVLLCATLAELAAAIARGRAVTLGPRLVRFLYPIELLVAPFTHPIAWVGRKLGAVEVVEAVREREARLAESEMEYLVEDAAKAGQLDAEPAEMIRNVLEFKDLTVRDVMVPRIKMVGVEISTPLDEVLAVVTAEGHSRYPVYEGKIDNVVGLLYTKDLFRILRSGNLDTSSLRDVVRTPVNFVPETQPVSAVLRDMRAKRHHMAVLVDEFGGVSGIVTLEDILEEIVGDIRDEYDREHDDAPIQDLGDGRLLADAAVSLPDLSAYLGREIEGEGDYGSLGGLLTHVAGKVPVVGEHVTLADMVFVVREADEKRIAKVEIVMPRRSGSMIPDSTRSLPPSSS
jgi:CBS domain containing-hemolysin-like protein